SRQRARTLRNSAWLQGRRDPDQRERCGTVRPGIRTVLAQGRGAGCAGGAASARLFRSETAGALLVQQHHRQSARYHDRAPYLILDGVRERHPNLKILAVHGGGYLAAYSGRIDHAWGARSDAHGELPHPPTSYLRKIYFDSVVFTPHQLAELVRLYGADRIIM